MLALIAGQGRLPVLLARRLRTDGVAFQVFELAGFDFENPDGLAVTRFRIEHLGSLLDRLVADGFDAVCFAGAIRRPVIDLSQIDGATAPLLRRIETAIKAGDDAALRAIVGLFTARGLEIRAAHGLMPELLADAGDLTDRKPGAQHLADAQVGWVVLDRQGARDSGQASVIAGGQVLAEENIDGTDAMLAGLDGMSGGILFKGPKPGQDRRMDMPTIGVQTVAGVIEVGLDGMVIEAGGVLVVDRDKVIAACDAAGIFLCVMARP